MEDWPRDRKKGKGKEESGTNSGWDGEGRLELRYEWQVRGTISVSLNSKTLGVLNFGIIPQWESWPLGILISVTMKIQTVRVMGSGTHAFLRSAGLNPEVSGLRILSWRL